jgi:hypothetical protein
VAKWLTHRSAKPAFAVSIPARCPTFSHTFGIHLPSQPFPIVFGRSPTGQRHVHGPDKHSGIAKGRTRIESCPNHPMRIVYALPVLSPEELAVRQLDAACACPESVSGVRC